MNLSIYAFCLLAPTAVFAHYIASVYYDGMEYSHFEGGHDVVDFLTARVSCSVLRPGHDIVQPKTESVNDAVVEATAPYYKTVWIGITDLYGESYWRWLNGEFVTWAKWGVDQPNYGSYDCGMINNYGIGNWSSYSCSSSAQGFVCESPISEAQPLDRSSLTFRKVATPVTFSEAQTGCENDGARLVKVASETAREILAQKIKTYGTKYWVDDEEVGCLMLNKERFEKQSCDKFADGYICETVRPHNVLVSDEAPIVSRGENLEIECSASGVPRPDVAWYKDEQLVENQSIGEASATLKITNAKESDGGLYVCRANNGSTKASGLSHLTVAAAEY